MRRFYVSKYVRYFEKTFNNMYYIYVFMRLCNIISPCEAAKVMKGYFRSYDGFKKVFLRMKRVKNLDKFNIDFDALVETFKGEKFKKTHSKNARPFKMTYEVEELHKREMYEYYCDCREALTGYRNTFGNPEVTKNMVSSNLKKYGVRSTAQLNWVKEKQANTNIKKYGVKSPLCKKETRDLRFENTGKLKQEREAKFEPTRELFLTFIDKGRFNTRKCAEFFGLPRKEILKLKKEFGISNDAVNPKEVTQNRIFDSIKTDLKYKNVRTSFKGIEIDIYLPREKMAIEYDGLMFHSQGVSKHSRFNTPDFDKNYHLKKTKICRDAGVQLFHIFEGENIDLWLSMINNKLGLNSRIYARNCYVEVVKSMELYDFLNENHLQGYAHSKINLTLKYEDEIVAAMTFSKPRYNKKYEYEMIRFCCLRGHSVIGGASKLFKFFLKKFKPKSVISYANLRFSYGALYETLGFSLVRETPPNYFYFKPNTLNILSRAQFQKHKLKDLLENYDASKSEVENMFANGYRRIFDCGNLVYEWGCEGLNNICL